MACLPGIRLALFNNASHRLLNNGDFGGGAVMFAGCLDRGSTVGHLNVVAVAAAAHDLLAWHYAGALWRIILHDRKLFLPLTAADVIFFKITTTEQCGTAEHDCEVFHGALHGVPPIVRLKAEAARVRAYGAVRPCPPLTVQRSAAGLVPLSTILPGRVTGRALAQ